MLLLKRRRTHTQNAHSLTHTHTHTNKQMPKDYGWKYTKDISSIHVIQIWHNAVTHIGIRQRCCVPLTSKLMPNHWHIVNLWGFVDNHLDSGFHLNGSIVPFIKHYSRTHIVNNAVNLFIWVNTLTQLTYELKELKYELLRLWLQECSFNGFSSNVSINSQRNRQKLFFETLIVYTFCSTHFSLLLNI